MKKSLFRGALAPLEVTTGAYRVKPLEKKLFEVFVK